MKEKTDNFVKPSSVNNYIVIWGRLDDIVHLTKKRRAIEYWERNCVPRHSDGTLFVVSIDPSSKKATFLSYENIMENRYLYYKEFEEDLKNYRRVYNLFCQTMALDK